MEAGMGSKVGEFDYEDEMTDLARSASRANKQLRVLNRLVKNVDAASKQDDAVSVAQVQALMARNPLETLVRASTSTASKQGDAVSAAKVQANPLVTLVRAS
jgi:hypothetical protein